MIPTQDYVTDCIIEKNATSENGESHHFPYNDIQFPLQRDHDVLAGNRELPQCDAGGGEHVLLGDLIALAGAACLAVYTILGKVCRKEISTTAYTTLVYSSAALTVLVILLCTGTPVLGYEPVNWLSALGMAVFCTLLGHSVFNWALKYASAAFLSTVKLLEPVFAAILGVLLFREIPSKQVMLGGFIVILGVYVYSRFSETPEKKAP